MSKKIDYASISYLLGVLSIAFAFISPVGGLLFGIFGFNQSKKMKIEESRKLNVIGIILSSIFIIAAVVIFAYSLISGVELFPVQ